MLGFFQNELLNIDNMYNFQSNYENQEQEYEQEKEED